MRRNGRTVHGTYLAVVWWLAAMPLPVLGAIFPADFRPVAAEGTARAAWVNPSAIGHAPWQSLVLEATYRETDDGDFDAGDPATLSVAGSTGRTAYAARYEFDDVLGVADWALLAANRVTRGNGTTVGTALEWRGGDGAGLDVTLGLSTVIGAGLRGSVVLEDVLETEVDGRSGARRWRAGLAWRPVGGGVYVSWDYDRIADGDDGRQWLGAGFDRSQRLLLAAATDNEGQWSARIGLVLGNARLAGALLDPEGGLRTGVASVEFLGSPIVR